MTPFEDATGCKVNTTAMTDSNNGVSLMQSGNYDGGSFSGDATTRLMVGGIVAPVNVALTPHIASASIETRTKMAMMAADNCAKGLTGQRPPNLINPEVLVR